MNLRDFMTDLNQVAQEIGYRTGDNAPEVIVTSRSGGVDFKVKEVFMSELDGKVCIRLADEVRRG